MSTSSTTTTAETTTTTSTTTSTSTTTTTTAPPVTIAPERCRGTTGPTSPEPVAETFYDAWTVDDRGCAEQIATEAAIETLFVIDGTDAGWQFQGCDTGDEAVDPETVCRYRYEGGSAHFSMSHGATEGWQITAVDFQVD